jgi:rubrerythrin
LSSGVRGGAVVAVGAMTAGLLAERAGATTARSNASGPLADLDLALARLAVGAEILAVEFYTRAIASKKLSAAETDDLERALFNEQEHLQAVSEILSGAGQTPSTADDFTITFQKGAFDSAGSIAKLGVTLETAFVGAYLGAVDAFGPADLKTTAARIAASESQHLSLFSGLASNRPVGLSFPAPLDYETTSDFLDSYLS